MATHSFALPSSAFRALRGWFLPDNDDYDLPVHSTGPNSTKVRLSAVQWNTRGLSVELRSGSWVTLEGITVLDYVIDLTANFDQVGASGPFVNQSDLATSTQRIYAARDQGARDFLTELGDATRASVASITFNFPDSPAPAGADNLYLGGSKVDKVYLGSTEVDAMYLGSTQIY